ncbi:unnamed protein product [Bursaphelenchus okinawaensis]|uniref:Uncharacterized protein n=1 Tax=Bursaphelenchus okinawaensis TaxID=465554 RepID=A0A811LSQ6_9BILA|nr:unnamed protein product [Bursaphelenchus okinawaensis]CAG9127893.1 unnamed protein product [Bursaphelenchus okinawaensis]
MYAIFSDVEAKNIITCPKDSSFKCYQQQAVMVFPGQKDLEMICYNKDNIEVMKTSIGMSLATECPMVNECENIEYPSPFVKKVSVSTTNTQLLPVS